MEAGTSSDDVPVAGLRRDDHGGWECVTVAATTVKDIEVHTTGDTAELRWVPADEIGELDLHRGFRANLAPTVDDAAQTVAW